MMAGKMWELQAVADKLGWSIEEWAAYAPDRVASEELSRKSH